jgi:predicted nucleotidyltransferase
MARGKMRSESDIDILCVIADATNSEQAEQRLHGATATLHRTFGRPVNILVWSKSALADRYRAKDRLARNIVNSGEVIWGAPLMEVLS